MANYFTVSSREEFNTRLWTRAAVDRQCNYKQAGDGRVLSRDRGEPPGQNDGKKNYHLNWVQHWWCFSEDLAEKESRPVNYSLVHEPPVPGINTQVEKCMLGFFQDLLAAQFADCPKFLRHAILELCTANKVADYMLLRIRDLPLQPALVSAEALLHFLNGCCFLRHFKAKPPVPYNEDTIKHVLTGGRKGSNCEGLEARASLKHISGKLIRRFKHLAMRGHVDSLGSESAARRYAKHSGKVHEASYSHSIWCPKLAMAKVAGHSGGFIQL